MREYKFRGKRLDNGEWVYGYYVFDAAQNIHQICTNHKGSCNASYDYLHEVYLVDPATVGQFTGLRDEGGEEGYAGDVLETPAGRKAVICFGKYHATNTEDKYHVGFHVKFEKKCPDGLYREEAGYWLPKSKIIGNIHDNPNLLEVAE